ncbi:E3 ubiquitin/ISG15 ligase TRIM25-like [Perca flavescens]|uniref:E3 ubiquitin/ISG15 ligase TRIM25-like n=1 Tax=Perca flavescens TaxID=8167 RepID=UPI00106E4125|nr:E3 ubiquitin/ISG15 ligase TRIM25-like [Perca flavescens]XP_028457925.1 E3 ubiquitin/ISG15 ligase TRIM25-like [Perca flavescens]
MAQKGVQLDLETFSCSICLDLLKDPVTTSCGHSYCMDCIKSHWDEEDRNYSYSCPQCRKMFTPRPVLLKNSMLADLVEELKKTGLQAAPADHCYAGAEDVACDVCTGRKLKAHKSCLICLVSFCEKHLQPHYDVAQFKKHKLVEPSKKLQENVCSRHDEVMKMFCRTDQQLICYLCSVEEHKGHDTVSAAAERTERQRELEGSRQNIQQSIQYREEEVEVLQQDAEYSKKIFTEMIRLLEKRSSDVKQQVRSQQKSEESRVRELQEKLEQEITELKRKDAELKKLSHTEDHTQFLHNYPSLSPLIQSEAKRTYTQPEPKTRAEFLKYSREITLDPNTANKNVLLSKGNRKATYIGQPQSYSSHPDRFTNTSQVLSRESLTGRCYWEVERRGRGRVYIAVAYKTMRRARVQGWDLYDSGFGFNDKSWALDCIDSSSVFFSDRVHAPVSGPVSSRVGVYLDHSAGILSFYSVCETMTLLHRVQTTFTRPLYAGLRVWYCEKESGVSAELCLN